MAETYLLGQSLGLDCATVTPKLLPYIGTVYVAHDMDFVRQALGATHNFLPWPPTRHGARWYLCGLFPRRVDRVVLDGVLDSNDYYSPNKDPTFDIGEADLAIHSFFQACHDAGPDACAIWANKTEGIRQRFLKADQLIHDAPLPLAGYSLFKWPL